MANQQKYANVADPHVSALVGGRYRFEKLDIALKKMDYFKEKYTIASANTIKNLPEGKNCFVFWIADFSITEEEEKQGYLGNYAFVAPEELPSGIVTLACVKLEVELKRHPRRKYEKQRVPNWSYPILRSVQKGQIYKTIAQAQARLDTIHLDFPEVTIPHQSNKLYIMIFDRKVNKEKPAQKYVLEIEAHEDGGFIIQAKLNEHKPKVKIKHAKDDVAKKEEREPLPPQGYFTSMIALKASKKSGSKDKPKSASKNPSSSAKITAKSDNEEE
jgi:hypothetical protein